MIKKIPHFAFDNEKKNWISVNEVPKNLKIPSKLKIVSQNILFDARSDKLGEYKPKILHSKERYESFLSNCKKQNPDIICCNEVTIGFIQLLQKDENIRQNYYITNIIGFKGYMGNIIITKYPFDELYEIDMKKYGLGVKPICGVFKNLITLCCTHLSAYPFNMIKRGKQLNFLYDLFDNKIKNSRTLILGDLNFHDEKENSNINNGYKDIWMLQYPKNYSKGYTFDATKNFMIYEMWPCGWIAKFKNRTYQMRLDRHILKCEKGINVKVIKMEVINDKPIYKEEQKRSANWKCWDCINYAFDLINVNLWRDKKNYLHISDHYGLSLELDFETK